MQEFRLTIELGNDAMQSAGDIGRALRSTAERIGLGRITSNEEGRIYDDNGNTVGSWTIL